MLEKETKNAAAARCLRILAVLPAHALTGISNKALAEHLKTSPVNVSRALATLEEEGYAMRLANGLWGPDVKLLALAVGYAQHVEEVKRRADTLQQRVFASSHQYMPQQ